MTRADSIVGLHAGNLYVEDGAPGWARVYFQARKDRKMVISLFV